VLKDKVLQSLVLFLGDRVSTASAICTRHGQDESWHPVMAPDAVCFPKSTDEVTKVVSVCASNNVPIIPFGAGTSLEGHIAALKGGVCIDLSKMTEIIAVRSEDMDCTVQPGVTRDQLDKYIRDQGLFFPIDPGAECTLGGMAATRASGTNAVRYGTMRENVLGLTVVLADGRIITTGSRARKSAAGYDLTRLFVGSEGGLGILTELVLRLHSIPEVISSAVVSFPTVEDAVNTVIATIQAAVPIARIELMDEVSIDAVNRYSKLSLPVIPHLFLEFHGTQAAVKEQAEIFSNLSKEFSGQDFQWSVEPEERSKLWVARHNAYYACLALRPGCKGLTTDVCVPISRLAECIAKTRLDVDQSHLLGPLLGHAGDGNFHVIFLVDPENRSEIKEAERLHDRMVERALAMGGTCTGEHGIGLGKIKHLQAEHGDGVDIMRRIKSALDPHNIMNPGKMLPL